MSPKHDKRERDKEDQLTLPPAKSPKHSDDEDDDPRPNPSSSSGDPLPPGPVLPLAQPSQPVGDNEPAAAQSPEPPTSPPAANDDSNETIEYPPSVHNDDSDATQPYEESFVEIKEPRSDGSYYETFQVNKSLLSSVVNSKSTLHSFVNQAAYCDEVITMMYNELRTEMRSLFGDESVGYWVDLVDGSIFRVDDSTATLSEEEALKYPDLVEEADRKEVEQFVHYRVFQIEIKKSLGKGANIVDCIWIRKWKVQFKIIKSRICSRGCFGKQKNTIERHSSTATRLSQRIVISLGMVQGMIYTFEPEDDDDVSTESLDISGAFLQGLEYTELAENARALGYEVKEPREVFVKPPENIWRHFRSIAGCPQELQVPDSQRYLYVLRCLRAMYGFVDAPLMFQLALLCYLIMETGAVKSIFDDNFLFWYWWIDGSWQLVLVLTAHVDDLQLTGSKYVRDWLHDLLEQRFGSLKRQQLPYTHAGLELERINPQCLFIHQTTFTSKLKPYPIDTSRDPEEELDALESTAFRSQTCSCLWACQTRVEEVCQVTSLQTCLKSPKLKDLMSINTVIKRLKKPIKHGIFLWKLKPPLRIVSVSDASSATKTSNYPTEGTAILLGEDRLSEVLTDRSDFLLPGLEDCLSGKFHLCVGLSSKAKRISHSTSHAETNAAAKTLPIAQLAAIRYAEPEVALRYDCKLRPLQLMTFCDEARCPVPVDAVIDCMDLWELICGIRGIPQDKSQRLGVLALREERRQLRLRRLYHYTTHYMLADQLTKYSGYFSKTLMELISSGHWTVKDLIRCRHGFGPKEKSEALE